MPQPILLIPGIKVGLTPENQFWLLIVNRLTIIITVILTGTRK